MEELLMVIKEQNKILKDTIIYYNEKKINEFNQYQDRYLTKQMEIRI